MNRQISDKPLSRVKQIARNAKRALRKQAFEGLSMVGQCFDSKDESKITILGPYRNRDKWRLVVIDGTERKSVCSASRELALALKDKLTRENERTKSQTVGMALAEYRIYLRDVRGQLPKTANHVHDCLARWLPLSLLATSLTASKAEKLYEDLTQTVSLKTGNPLSVTTHHFFLTLAKGWGKWAQKERILSANPFADIEPLGKRRAGKMQLRIDEAQHLSHVAAELAGKGDSGALGVLLMLHLGLRQGEVGARVARDVDANGKILWVPAGKTKNAARRLKVPEFLQIPLLTLASQKQPTDLLFTDGANPPPIPYFWKKVRRLCALAKVPIVCPHSLRGLHATLALEAGATSSMVAHALGHGSFEITARHYASAESVQGARSARVAEALAGGADDPVSRLLAGLTATQLAELKTRLK